MGTCSRCGRTALVVVLVPRASVAVREGRRPDNPLRKRGVADCLLRSECPWHVEREAERRRKRAECAAARRPDLRPLVFERDRGLCVDCGERHEEWDADHVLPLADGGEHSLSNIATRCRIDHRTKTAQENRARARRVRWEVPMEEEDSYGDVPAAAAAA